jgi:arylsulfatase A-like enzyme
VKGEKFALRVGRWKLIEGPEEGTRELFDLAADPRERHNRIDASPEVAADLAARLAAWRAGRAGAPGAPQPLAPDERERLRALGYTE